jgi:hypothetical protein
MTNVMDDLLAVVGVRRVALEALLGRQVAERQRYQAEREVIDARLDDLAGRASALRDEWLRREREDPATASLVLASISIMQVRRPLVVAQRDAVAAMHEQAAALVAATNRKLSALGEREKEYRRLARREALRRDADS